MLIDKKEKLLKLLEISDLYRRLSVKYGLKVSAKDVNKFCMALDRDGKSKAELCKVGYPQKDMDLVGKCKLVLMEKDENRKKSNN